VYLDNRSQRFKTVSVAPNCTVGELIAAVRDKMVGIDCTYFGLFEVHNGKGTRASLVILSLSRRLTP